VASEAIYHAIGGKNAGWKPCVMRLSNGDTHWWLQHESGLVLDVSAKQFGKAKIDYSLGRGTGFLTKRPSRKATVLMKQLIWQEVA
jgi:hypothetical protein